MMDTLIEENVMLDEYVFSKTESKIPRDENGVPIGRAWEDVLEDMYNDLSKHYGVDLRTL